jgi:hypothetical protein
MIQHSLIADHHLLYVGGSEEGGRESGGEREDERRVLVTFQVIELNSIMNPWLSALMQAN